MKSFVEKLGNQLEMELNLIEHTDEVQLSKSSSQIAMKYLERLKTFAIKYQFTNKEEEIFFFKTVKPQFVAQVIIHSERYRIALNRPFGNSKQTKNYLVAELDRIQQFYKLNKEFLGYYRSGQSTWDKQYFVRNPKEKNVYLEPEFISADPRFTTPRDQMMAKVIASERLYSHIESQLLTLKRKITTQPSKSLQWTGSKVALIELMYALHTNQVFNNGNAELNEVARFFELAFNIDLGQFHRTFFEICARKSDRLKFLNGLCSSLLKKMEDSDA